MSGEPVARRRYYSPFEVTPGRPIQAARFLFSPFADSVVCLQVSQHTAPQDCWVSILGEVFDITPLVKVHGSRFSYSVPNLRRMGYSALLARLAGSAGHCCSTFGSSCWHRHLTLVHAMLFDYILRRAYTCAADMAYTLRFDAKTGDIKLFVDPLTNVQSAYCPQVCTVCTCVLHSMQLEGA